MNVKSILLASVAALAFAGAASVSMAADGPSQAVKDAVADGGRANWDTPRDADMKPADVLAFSGIKPGMVVVDLVPGDGYYTRILSKLVGPKGKVYALVAGSGGNFIRTGRMAEREQKAPATVLKDDPRGCLIGCYTTGAPPALIPIDYILALENLDAYSNVKALGESLGSYGGDFAVPEQVDAVFTSDGYHVLHTKVDPIKDNVALDKSIFNAMKPGGVFIVADYADAKGAGFKDTEETGRVDPDAVKAEVTAAGFVLDGESPLLANASDDHSKAADDKSDQFLFRFKKPANASGADMRPKGGNDPLKSYYGNTLITNVGAGGNATGARERRVYYNKDHTYQEFGRLGAGPAPTQQGTWFWDADGHVCMLHQFPVDERGMIVCQTSAKPDRQLNVVTDEPSNAAGGRTVKMELLSGHELP